MSSHEDQCGVWIDTEQLRGKVQQRKAAPPISKLLNGVLRGELRGVLSGGGLGAARTLPLRTRQSSISSFFAPRPRSDSGPARSCEQATAPTSGARRLASRDRDAACLSSAERDLDREGAEGKKRRAAPSPSRHPRLPPAGALSETAGARSETAGARSETAGARSETAEDGPDAAAAARLLHTSPPMDLHHTRLSGGGPTEALGLLEALSKEDDETLTSVTSLFTRDSQGFMVMAHGAAGGRAERWLDDEDALLFTQDTQGNTVIKHGLPVAETDSAP